MSAATPISGKKRTISGRSTPSPSTRRSTKSVRMSATPENTIPQSMSTSLSDLQIDYATLPEDILDRDDNQKWELIINYVKHLNGKILELQAENNDLHSSVETANGRITFLEKKIEKAK